MKTDPKGFPVALCVHGSYREGVAGRTQSEPALPGEPEGWRELQEKLRLEKDPKKFAELVDQISRLLTEWEKKNTTQEPNRRPERTDAP